MALGFFLDVGFGLWGFGFGITRYRPRIRGGATSGSL